MCILKDNECDCPNNKRETEERLRSELNAIVRRTRRNEKLTEYVKSHMYKNWLQWPTVRDLAIKYKCRQDEIVDIVESNDNLDLIVGMRAGGGIASFDSKGDYRVEWYA